LGIIDWVFECWLGVWRYNRTTHVSRNSGVETAGLVRIRTRAPGLPRVAAQAIKLHAHGVMYGTTSVRAGHRAPGMPAVHASICICQLHELHGIMMS
jgi:hypothetical protein